MQNNAYLHITRQSCSLSFPAYVNMENNKGKGTFWKKKVRLMSKEDEFGCDPRGTIHAPSVMVGQQAAQSHHQV